MKNLFSSGRWLAVGVLFAGLVFCTGCEEKSAQAQLLAVTKGDPVPAAPPAEAPLLAAAADAQPAAAETKPAPSPVPQPATPPAPGTNAAIQAALQAPQPVPPDAVRLSPGLADVLKLVQSGVSEDLLLAYVTNSMHVFEIGPNEIVYLHDLGLSDGVITRLIQQDSSPDSMARKQSITAVQPLPPGVALKEPATNLFQHAQKITPWPAATPHEVGLNIPQPPAPIPVATAQTDTNAPPPPDQPQVVVEQPVAGQQPVNVAYFETALSPYGSWFHVDGYGQCWRPTVAVLNASWRPYADHGRWLWSDCGWYWYSDYSWGWAPFHYGRWNHTAHHGWHWVPGTHWGPSWVTWRYTDSYCGWAPLPPSAHYYAGYGFYHNTVSVGLHFGFGLADYHYTYVPFNRFCDRAPYHYYLPRSHAYAVHKNSTVVNNYIAGNNNTIINDGVGYEKVAKVTRGDIRKIAIRDSAEPRSLAVRRERLETDGRTLTVARIPAPVSLAPVGKKAPAVGGHSSQPKGSVVYPGAASAIHKGGTAPANATASAADPAKGGTHSAGPRVAPMRDASTTVKKETQSAGKSVPAQAAGGNAEAYNKPAGRVAEYESRRTQPNSSGKAAPLTALPAAPAGSAVPKGSIVMRGPQGATSARGGGNALPSWAVPAPASPTPAAPTPKAGSVSPAPVSRPTPGAPSAVARVPGGASRAEVYQGYRSQPAPPAPRADRPAYAPPSAPAYVAPAARPPSYSPPPSSAPSFRPGSPVAPRVESSQPAPSSPGGSSRAQSYRSGGFGKQGE